MPTLSLMDQLEEEAIYVLREVAGQFDRTAILFSGGKDSITLAHLARKAFAPLPSPFPLLHVDTGHNFHETIEFRDRFAAEIGAELIVRLVQDTINSGRAQEETGPHPSRNAIQSVTLMDAIRELKLDCAIGGARRDEEKARAKERFFSHRNEAGRWEPRQQRPELWRHYNGAKTPKENFRVFPLSNWTEIDVWQYIQKHNVPLPNLYLAHQRPVFERDGVLYAQTSFLNPPEGTTAHLATVRFRTVGDATCTGAIRSSADTVETVVAEIRASRLSERATRGDDRRSESAMEDRKSQGYF